MEIRENVTAHLPLKSFFVFFLILIPIICSRSTWKTILVYCSVTISLKHEYVILSYQHRMSQDKGCRHFHNPDFYLLVLVLANISYLVCFSFLFSVLPF